LTLFKREWYTLMYNNLTGNLLRPPFTRQSHMPYFTTGISK